MILTCPACATQYSLPDGSVGPMGRKVRCQSCGETWQASADDTPLELTAAPVAATPEPTPGIDADTPAPVLPRAFRARAEQQRRVRRAATHGAVWAGMASAFVALLGAAWLMRVDVVELYPRAAAAYAMIGAPVNPVGLEFEAVGAKVAPNDPGKVLVSGALRNVRDNEIVAPAVRVALLDAHGAEIGFKVVRIDAAPVLPGKVQGFAAVIPDPGGHGVDVGVAFFSAPVLVGKSAAHDAPADHAAPAHGQDAAAPPQDHAAADQAPAPMRVPPGAEEGGLRPALDIGGPHGADPAPVDARPLDNHHGEAVSASHHG
ncbi:MAG: hypothetical protein EON88_10335 [Brevundimonas sp.]|nr:MAG: hypothetical protein EON88_10335 [Brevundimonas sp.]